MTRRHPLRTMALYEGRNTTATLEPICALPGYPEPPVHAKSRCSLRRTAACRFRGPRTNNLEEHPCPLRAYPWMREPLS
jgi:hypothetical protein